MNLFQPGTQFRVPTLVLESKDKTPLGVLDGAADITYKKNLNSANELSFTLYKCLDGKQNPLWNALNDLKNIYIPEFKERFAIKVSCQEEVQETKAVTGTSLCEAELGQILLRGLEINTEQDLKNNTSKRYQTTVFYRDILYSDSDEAAEDKKKHSLLHRVLGNHASHYKIGTIDQSLKDLAFTFSADGTNIYDFLTGEVAKQMQCLFEFDSITRTINAYALSDDPGTESYGNDTAILIDRENLASSLTCEGDVDSLKNCFYVEGGDETINAAFAQINPSGEQYLYYFSPEMLAEMPPSLRDAIGAYNAKAAEPLAIMPNYTTHQYIIDPVSNIPYLEASPFIPTLPDTRYLINFQKVVEQITALTDDSGKKPYQNQNYTIPDMFNSHAELVAAYYDALDFQSFLEYSMMPDYKMEVYDKYEALSRLNQENFGTIGIAELNPSLTSSIEHAICNKAKTLVNTALYEVSIEKSKITKKTGKGAVTVKWTGTFSITDRQDTDSKTNTITNSTYQAIAKIEGISNDSFSIPANVTLTINDDVDSYAKNSIEFMLSKKDLPMACDLYSPDVSLTEFNKALPFYGEHSLQTIQDTLTDCLGIIETQLEDMKNSYNKTTTSSIKKDPMYQKIKKYKDLYQEKLDAVSNHLITRTTQMDSVGRFLMLMEAYLKETREAFHFENYLKTYAASHNPKQNLWEIFQSYRREGEYQNSNIISTNLKTNADVMRHAQKLLEYASKELKTAGTLQYRISTTMDNLLALPEFQQLQTHADTAFDVGNWIRVRMDVQEETGREQIYKLRLLSFQVNYETHLSSDIQVEFSTVTRGADGVLSDVEGILDAAQGMATSYSTLARQVELGHKAAELVDHWVSDGLDLTNQKIVNNLESQSLLIDNKGLLARKFEGLTNSYDDCQLRIINNGIYTTHDNWKTIDAAFGKFQYKNPDNNWETTETYGIIAHKLVGEQILGEDLRISNSSGSMQFHDQGLVVSNGISTITISPNVSDSPSTSEKLFCISSKKQNSDGTPYSEDVFYTDSSGNLNITGKITAESGSIGGFNIRKNYFANGTSSLGANKNSVYLGTNGISCGTAFQVTKTGKMTASDVTIQASSGENAVVIDKNGIQSNRYMCGDGSQGVLCFYGYCAGNRAYCNLLKLSGNTADEKFYTTYLDTDCDCFFLRKPLYVSDMVLHHTLSVGNTISAGNLSLTDSITQGSYSNTGTDLHLSQCFKYDHTNYQGILKSYPATGTLRVGLYDATNDHWKSLLDFKPNGTISVSRDLIPSSKSDLDLGSQSHFWNCTYSRSLHLKPGSYQTVGRINCTWKDGETHDALTITEDGLSLYLGWAGSSAYPSATILRGSSVHLKNASGPVVTSDQRLKHSFKTMEEYEGFFDALQPCFFKLSDGTSNRFHSGFQAQQVLNALEQNNLTSQDFAGYVSYPVSKDSEEYRGFEEEYGLIYSEFTALNTHMIQKTRLDLQESNDKLQKIYLDLQKNNSAIQNIQSDLQAAFSAIRLLQQK